MKILSKLQEQYDQLWKYIIRPQRTEYKQSALGPELFTLQNTKVKRNSFKCINQNSNTFSGSHFVPIDSNSYPCVIYLHGNSSNQTQGMEYISILIKNNISLCTFDFPGCGNAEGEYVTLGYRQWKDVEQVVEHIKNQQKVTKIAIWGRSMGAVTALCYAHHHPQLCGAIYDSPFKSLKSLVNDLTKKNSKLPKFIVLGALKIISKTIKQKIKFDIYELNPLQNQAPNIDVPGFFIVGDQDQLIPFEHTKLLYQVYKSSQKEIRIVNGQHNQARPESCIKDAVQFLKKILFSSDHQQYVEIKQIDNRKNKSVDFFNDKLISSLNNKETILIDNKQVDFFDESYGKDEQELQLKQDDQSKHQLYIVLKANIDMFSIFSGMSMIFGGKQKKVKKANDGYEQLRNRLLNISFHKYINNTIISKQQQLIQKQLRNYDNKFQKMLSTSPFQYIW